MDNKDLPAMPLVNANGHPYHANSIAWENSPLTSGLTKREHFAGLAMQGWLARCANTPHSHKLEPEGMARVAVEMADALLAQLDKGDK